MSDITELFQAIGPDGTGDPAAATVDGDLTRGRVALVRAHRRAVVRRSMVATGSLVVAAAVAVTATQLGGSSNAPTTANHAGSTKIVQHHHANAVQLVDWTGKQLNGFNVDEVPAGWHLSGSTQYALTINSADDSNTDPNVFEGKLTVLLASVDEQSFPANGQHVTVDGQPGVVWNGGEWMLGYTDAAGHRVVIQAPDALHWTADQLVSFAEGVHVTSNALAGRG